MARGIAVFLLGLGLAACSGAAPTDVLGSVATNGTKPVPTAGSGAAATGASGATTPAGGEVGKPGDGPSATPVTTAPAPPIGVVPSPEAPTVSCVVAIQGDSSPDKATAFTSCVTGTLADRSDNDFLSIVAPDNARTMMITHQEDGHVVYRVGADFGDGNIQFDQAVFTDGNQQLRATPGATYYIRVNEGFGGGGTGDTTGPRSYGLTVTFETHR
jgi:hypothetical protein